MATKEAKRQRPDGSEPRMIFLGNISRTSREGRMTVEELAEQAGVSGGLISQLERGIGNPSFNTIMRLSRALGLPISSMFQGEDDHELERDVVRSDGRRRLLSEMEQELLTPDANHRLGLVRTIVPPGYSSEDTPMTHPGDEVFLVLEGRLEVTVGAHSYTLEEGDTVSFNSAIPHAYANRSDKQAVFLGASTPSTVARFY